MEMKTTILLALTLFLLTPSLATHAVELEPLPALTFAAIERSPVLNVPKATPVSVTDGELDHVLKYLSVQSFTDAAVATADMKRVSQLLTNGGYVVVASGTYSEGTRYEIDYVPASRYFSIGHHNYYSYTAGNAGNLTWDTRAQAEAAMKASVAAFEQAGYIVLQSAVQESPDYYFGLTFMAPR